ncbi:hypothetical protein CKG00_03075 [Morganella morganii]|uniref:Uncharacterized protein n=1 Tax=Morganella morganii TaxID=582 RepID=A0A433ZTS4_MORMO|nr:hypothetical protein [Morganella morganii]RUT65499.1 hypothetical protein CKG00_03075 [Morganella morganii]
MTEEKFKLYVNIIRLYRDYDSFTNSDAAQYTGTSEVFIRTYTSVLYKIGSLIKMGMVKQGRHYIPQYEVAPDAITRLYRYVRDIRGEPEPHPVMKCPSKGMKRIKFCGRVVNKAYISPGFGRSAITDIDSRLNAVRNKDTETTTH